MLVVLFACSDPPPAPEPASAPAMASAAVLRVAGAEVSRAITDPVGEALAAQGIVVTPVAAAGGGDAIKALRAGTADLAVLGRAFREGEIGLVSTTIGYDAAVLVAANEVRPLAMADLPGLFSGEGSSVGGPGAAVHLYVGPPERGATRLLRDHLGLEGDLPATVRVIDPERALLEAVAADPLGLGVVSLQALGAEGAPALATLALDGVAPEAANIASGAYPLALPLTVVTVGEPSPAAQTFVAYLLSDAGQVIVKKRWVGLR